MQTEKKTKKEPKAHLQANISGLLTDSQNKEKRQEFMGQTPNPSRRSFLKNGLALAAAGTVGAGLLANGLTIPKAAGSPEQASAAQESVAIGTSNGINVVLVHGIWADGSSYSRVIPLLLNQGYTVYAPQLPLTTHLADDVTAALGVIQQIKGPTVLVGHSYGGAIITNAGAGLSN